VRTWRKRWLPVALAVLLSLLLVVPLRPRWLVERLAERSPDVVYFVDTQRPMVALTIDDGPDSAATPLILDILKRHNAHATFFIITEKVPGNERLLQRMVAEGHEVGNHLTRDEPSIRLPSDAFEAELLTAHRELLRFAEPRWFRPGGGWFNDRMLSTARRHGYRCALGSVYPFDATIPSARFAAWYVLANARRGSVIVLHDGGARGRRTAAALERILPELDRRGLEAGTLSILTKESVAGATLPRQLTATRSGGSAP
jgi:peptidoglycan/xylan/chitin deacetylase (PgdA/CDA1 family)